LSIFINIILSSEVFIEFESNLGRISTISKTPVKIVQKAPENSHDYISNIHVLFSNSLKLFQKQIFKML
jgi:hypothetical protein